MNPLTKGQNVYCSWKCPHIINITLVIYRIYDVTQGCIHVHWKILESRLDSFLIKPANTRKWLHSFYFYIHLNSLFNGDLEKKWKVRSVKNLYYRLLFLKMRGNHSKLVPPISLDIGSTGLYATDEPNIMPGKLS